MCLTDLMPTAASIAGASLPKWAAEDGTDQSSQFLDPNAESVRNSVITQSYTGILSIRRDNWKLIFDTLGSGGFYKYSDAVEPMHTMASWRLDLSRTGQLFNLANDPFEQTNLYETKPTVVKELTKEIQTAINAGRSRPN
jgi:arylsulfatase A